MGKTEERRISGLTFFEKFILPPAWLGFLLFWIIEVAFVSGIQRKGPSPAIGCVGLVMFGAGLFYFIRYHFPLKLVWMGERGLRVSNFRKEIVIPYEAIEKVAQKPGNNPGYVVVTLNLATPFGRRFTFLPRYPKFRWAFGRGIDQVVVELRDRVEAARARKAAKPTAAFGSHEGLSPMADDELEGPL